MVKKIGYPDELKVFGCIKPKALKRKTKPRLDMVSYVCGRKTLVL
jgi:hypothetical protein